MSRATWASAATSASAPKASTGSSVTRNVLVTMTTHTAATPCQVSVCVVQDGRGSTVMRRVLQVSMAMAAGRCVTARMGLIATASRESVSAHLATKARTAPAHVPLVRSGLTAPPAAPVRMEAPAHL